MSYIIQNNPNQTQTVSQMWQGEQAAAAQAMQGCAYLTPDSLMAYCQSRLQGLDTQVNEAFAQQQHSNQVSSLLSKLLGDPRMAIPSDTLKGTDATNKIHDAEQAIRDALHGLDKDSPEYNALVDLANNIEKLGDPLSPTTFQNSVVNPVNDVQKQINSSSELSMIGLQSLVSQRQQAIQVCTNLVQSLGDQCNKIAENIGK